MVMECCFCVKKVGDDAGRTFHQFPFKQPELMESWLKNMGLGSDFKPLRTMRLCSDHFTETCLRRGGVNVQLATGSIPTLFGTFKSACAYCGVLKTQEDDRSFHKFPLRNPNLLQKWVEATRKANYIPNESSRLCSDHFENTCFRSSGYKNSLRLRNTAIPTIFHPLTPKGRAVLAQKRPCGSPWESPAVKHYQADTGCKMAVHLKAPSPQQEIPELQECIAVSHDIDDCTYISPTNHVEQSLSEDASNESLQGMSTPNRTIRRTASDIAKQTRIIKHDHHYENTLRTTRRQLMAAKQKIKNMQQQLRVHKQHITRLKRQISSLKDIVSELRKRNACREPGLACLDCIADDDVSQFLERYSTNLRNTANTKPADKKRKFK